MDGWREGGREGRMEGGREGRKDGWILLGFTISSAWIVSTEWARLADFLLHTLADDLSSAPLSSGLAPGQSLTKSACLNANDAVYYSLPILLLSSGQRAALPGFFTGWQKWFIRSWRFSWKLMWSGTFAASRFSADCSKVNLRSRDRAALAWLGGPQPTPNLTARHEADPGC